MHILRHIILSALLMGSMAPIDIQASGIGDRSVIRIIPLIPKPAVPSAPPTPPAKVKSVVQKSTNQTPGSLKTDRQTKSEQITTEKRYHAPPRRDVNRVNVLILPPTSTAE
jgi:hypothetical protein